MKIGDLAGIFEKPVQEFAKTYEIGEGVEEIDLETISKILTPEITALKKALLKKGKDDGYGMAERLVKTEIEKRMKSEFGVDGESLDDLFTGLKTKIQPKDPKETDKLTLEFERLKEQKVKIETEFETFKKGVENEKKLSNQFHVFDGFFSSKFDVKSERLKKLAFEGFVKDFDIEQGKDSVFAIDKKTNKPLSDNVEDLIFNLYKDDFTPKGENKPNSIPSVPGSDPKGFEGIGNNSQEILAQLRKEKDPIRIQQLQAKLKLLGK